MGEEVVSSYLQSKLSSILMEAKADSDSPSHITSRISAIESDQIKSNSPTMIPLDRLYKLIELVSDCRVFAYKRRTAAVSKKGFDFITNPVSEFIFNKRMKKQLREIETSRPNGSSHRTQPQPPDMKPTSPSEDSSHFIGFEADAITIMTWLMPKQQGDTAAALKLRAVGIVGRCGCGKTALAQKVFNSPSVKEEFSPRIWVCLSNMLLDDDRKVRVRVVNHILREIDEDDDDDRSLDNLMEKLKRGLRGKRYLIVLDNAWRLDEWYEELFSHGLPSGGAVIVTSRREDVIRRTVVGDGDDRHVIRLQPHLSDENCWEIFSQVLQQQRKMYLTNTKLSLIQDDVKRSIDGLPLVAKTLANILPGLLLKTHWIRARDLNIAWGNNASYWRWTSHQEITEEVAELVDVCWLDISGRVGLKELLINTSYSAYIVFKLKKDRRRLEKATARVSIDCDGKDPQCVKERIVSIESEGVQRNGEEWKEMKLGDIFTTLGNESDGRLFEASFFEHSNVWKSGLVVKGIEFRPGSPVSLPLSLIL